MKLTHLFPVQLLLLQLLQVFLLLGLNIRHELTYLFPVQLLLLQLLQVFLLLGLNILHEVDPANQKSFPVLLLPIWTERTAFAFACGLEYVVCFSVFVSRFHIFLADTLSLASKKLPVIRD
jgi:hypothetical protein